jgi:hypothetical protein
MSVYLKSRRETEACTVYLRCGFFAIMRMAKLGMGSNVIFSMRRSHTEKAEMRRRNG